jgi:predicted glycosyltransferase
MNRPKQPYLLVTGGGGGDGARLMGQVLSAYESGGEKLPHALLVLGPLMPSDQRAQIFARAGAVESVGVIEFDNNMEDLIEGAAGIVGMCGYNTFCEVLSFNKPALIVPRTNPREEQFIRATRADELGLLQVMLPDDADDAQMLAGALAGLSNQPLPAESGGDAMLQGLDSVSDFVSNWAEKRPTADLYALSGAV